MTVGVCKHGLQNREENCSNTARKQIPSNSVYLCENVKGPEEGSAPNLVLASSYKHFASNSPDLEHDFVE